MNQHSNMYSGQVQQHGQSSYYSNTQSPSSAMQQVTKIRTEYVFESLNSQIVSVVALKNDCVVSDSCLTHYYINYFVFPTVGDCPSAQFPALLAKLWLRRRPATPGTAPHSSPGPAPYNQSTAPCFPAVQGHNGPQPQHDAAAHQQGTDCCVHFRLSHVSRGWFQFPK